jgi:hypothetical protein
VYKMAKRYSDKQKTSLLAKYHTLRKSGKTAQQAAKAVNVSYLTLRKWEKSSPASAASRKGTVADVIRSGSIALTTPAGYRIETDSPEQMAAVLNMLQR